MHPAFSVILFTTLSGAGYGLVALLGGLAVAERIAPERWLGIAGFGLGLAAISAGLLASTFHLGHPERAWRAFSQWRSSWLSREGVMSVLAFPPMLIFAYGWIFRGSNGGIWAFCGALAAAAAVITVYCTAMIYVSLKPIRRWHNGWVAPGYLLFALSSGALWLAALLALLARPDPLVSALALGAALASGGVKLGYWWFIDRSDGPSTAETATGLGNLGSVRLLEAPHGGENYLMREMGFRVARRHAAKLRRIALLLAALAPAALTAAQYDLAPAFGAIAALLAALLAMVGILVERWLFFAEAKHAVTLYYGATRA
jgi:sulfite dehydrogenase (quinone) subunit SoeC